MRRARPTAASVRPHLRRPDILSLPRVVASCGKTTLARLLARRTDAVFKELSATDSGIAEVRAVVEEAKNLLALTGR